METINFEDNIRLPIFTVIINISYRCAIIMFLWLPVFVVCLPLYLLGLSIWGLPPIISPWSRFVKYFVAVFTAGRADDNIPFTNRVFMFLMVFTILLKVPFIGIFWFIDELLFSKYHKIIIKEPVVFITGCQSGSTQLSHYLEDDKVNFIAPTVAESLFPFIWYWKLIVPVLKAAGVINETDRDFSQPQNEFDKRHTVEMHRTESIEINANYWHFNSVSLYLGADFMKWGFPFVRLTDSQIDDQFCSSLIQYYDLIVKKVLYYRGTPTQRVFVKGHSLTIANELGQRYKEAKFFTTLLFFTVKYTCTSSFPNIPSIAFLIVLSSLMSVFSKLQLHSSK